MITDTAIAKLLMCRAHAAENVGIGYSLTRLGESYIFVENCQYTGLPEVPEIVLPKPTVSEAIVEQA